MEQINCGICEIGLLAKQWHQSYIIGLVQDCSNSIANALELLQSCTKPLIDKCIIIKVQYNLFITQYIITWYYM